MKKDKEFEKFAGHLVQLKLFQPYEGQKVINGTLVGLIDDCIVVETEQMGRVEMPKSKVSLTKLVVEFE